MLETITTAIITGSSVLLFGYWFRYTCLLILTAKTARDYTGAVAEANQLRFLEVQSQLKEAPSRDLDRLRDTLDRDYAVLAELLNSAASDGKMEQHMLAINYRVMNTWYRVSSRFSPQAARNALIEMTSVVAYFANSIGEQSYASA